MGGVYNPNKIGWVVENCCSVIHITHLFIYLFIYGLTSVYYKGAAYVNFYDVDEGRHDWFL